MNDGRARNETLPISRRRLYRLTLIACSLLAAFAVPVFSKDDDTPLFTLFDPGAEHTIDYARYGTFSGVGTFGYKYTITDAAGLAAASGEGIDPNTSVELDPAFQRLKKSGALKGSYWKHVGTADPQADFFAWATAAKESPGVRLFFTARALHSARLYLQALKAYRAAMILYPDAFCWNREMTWTWLIAPAAWDEIVNITRMRPELGVKLSGAFVSTQNAVGGDPKKNYVAVTPGDFAPYTPADRERDSVDVGTLKIVERRGGRRSACVKYSNGQWGLEVDGRPFFVKGLTYGPTRVGEKYDWDWMHTDRDKNGMIDVAYDAWVDSNRNNRRDKDEPPVGDFQLMKEMGCNVIRFFNTIPINKALLRDMHKRYGIRVLICDPLGAYTVHSGARWEVGTDYTDASQLASMKKAAVKTVMECKDEEWLLGYILGNENNLPAGYMGVNASRTMADSQPKEYAEFLNEVASIIHKLDPDHIVGVGNLGLGLADAYAIYAPELDFIGVNSYPGSNGFGALWIRAGKTIDRAILIAEFGCDAYATGKGPDEDAQAGYLRNAWQDIEYNAAGRPGAGNSIGGILFEWLDEWWKDTRGDPLDEQNTEATFEFSFPDGFSQEEWLGIVGQGNGKKSPFLRDPRKGYYTIKDLWSRQTP